MFFNVFMFFCVVKEEEELEGEEGTGAAEDTTMDIDLDDNELLDLEELMPTQIAKGLNKAEHKIFKSKQKTKKKQKKITNPAEVSSALLSLYTFQRKKNH